MCNADNTTVSCFQNMGHDSGSNNTAQQMEMKSESMKTMTTHSCESSMGQTNLQQMPETNSYNSIFSSNNTSNSDSLVSSFLDELSSDLLNPEKYSPMDEGKKGFSHLGDSFESLQGTFNSLQDSDLNLDQLFDMPDIDRIYKDLTNNGGLNELSNSLNVNGDSPKTFDSTCQKPNVQTSLSQSQTSNFNATSSPMHDMVNSDNIINGLDPLCVTARSQGQGHLQASGGQNKETLIHTTKTPCTIASITDFSPDWAYTEV